MWSLYKSSKEKNITCWLKECYECYVLVANTIFHTLAAFTRAILFLPLEHKIDILLPPCNILSLSDETSHLSVPRMVVTNKLTVFSLCS